MTRLLGQDIVIAIRLLKEPGGWKFEQLGNSVRISSSQAHSSYKRLVLSNLVDPLHKITIRKNLLELLIHGVKYFFPSKLSEPVKGFPTASSSHYWQGKLISNSDYKTVWFHPKGKVKGLAIEPVFKTVPEITRDDPFLYNTLSILDSIRTGKARERKEAEKAMEKLIYE